MVVKIPKESNQQLADLRKGIAHCISSVLAARGSTAIVHDNWALHYDLDETIEAISLPNGRIHSWIIRISSIGSEAQTVGAMMIEMPLEVRITGFVGYQYGTDNNSRQSLLEKECKDIIKTLYLNQGHLGMDNPGPLRNVGFLTFEDIDVRGFGSGSDIIIAEGRLTLEWRENMI